MVEEVLQPRTEDTAAAAQTGLRESGLDLGLPDRLRALRDHILARCDDLEVLSFRGELTLVASPATLLEVLGFCRDDPDVACELLADLSGVHWPGETVTEQTHETTGWPTFAQERAGRIEVDYILRSLRHNHLFRIRLEVPDDGEPHLPSATGLYASANVMEREVWDFFGIRFDGHPNLVRILMPDEWEGHPHRKDYPIGGVEVQYKGTTVPPPDERKY